MNPGLHQEYLTAMGIDVWVLRNAEPDPPPELSSFGLTIGPGSGGTLLLCGSAEDAATPLAADIARSLGGDPVWGWPASDDEGGGVALDVAVKEQLFTHILMLGPVVPGGDAVDSMPVMGSARVIEAQSVQDLLTDPVARKKLWALLSSQHWSARPWLSP